MTVRREQVASRRRSIGAPRLLCGSPDKEATTTVPSIVSNSSAGWRGTIQSSWMFVRKQIMVPATVDKKIRRLARKRGISQSALIVEAVEALPDSSGPTDHVLAFVGVIKGASPKLSETVDDIYG